MLHYHKLPPYPESHVFIFRFTRCKSFKESVVIIHSLVKVVCRNTFLMKVYENVHATTLMDDVQYVDDLKHNSAFKILLVGIDSISKQNLNRTMPKSYEYLEKNFINLKGYNKIAENTYPNLMAILTGQNMTQLDETCPFLTSNKNKRKDFVSTCGLIWKDYKCSGYITGFGEDYCSLSTFNFDKKGFPDPPTDYYYRPYFLAAEQLKSAGNKCNTGFCSGPESSGERVLNIAKDFSITFKDQLSFGLFWMNTFSHDSFNCPSVMDEKVLQFLSDPSFVDSLNDTIFVFFSDHGFRFGAHRRTNSGWLEERLPFIYMRIPNKFQTNFPREYKNFLTNSLRLTTPYDFHNTLQHVLKLYNTSHTSLSSPGCPKCHSLFEEVDEKRTCQDAGITQRWCTCTSYSHLPTTDSYVQSVANFVVQTINGLMRTFPDGGKCVPYFLDSVLSVGTSEVRINAENEKVNYVLVTVKTNTKAMFESTVEVPVEGPERLKIVGSISRVDRYADTSFCVRSSELKKYCYCAGGATAFKICLDLGIC